MKNRKILVSILMVIGLLSITIGTTVAFFNYTRTGNANTVSVGRISFVTRQTKTISLNNLFPIDPTNSEEMSDTTKVGTLEIEIEGDTDYIDGVEYLVSSENTHITTSSGKVVPISLDVEITNLGTSSNNYFTAREDKNATIYKKLVGDTIVGDQMLLVGYIKPNTTSGTIEGVNGKLTIKAYLDENKILISDTYDGTESDNMGTPNSMARGKTVLTTTEWNALSTSGVSFQIKVEANEGIWVNDTLDNIIRTKNINTTTNRPIMDNEQSEFVTASTGIDFGNSSSDTNGKGIYMRAGTENDAYPIVYYRGAVEDNNVVFNDKCWKAVRTTDTGGVKLIYNGEVSEALSDDITDVTDEQLVVDTNTSGFVYDNIDHSWNATLETGTLQEFSFYLPNGKNYTFTVTGTTTQTGGGSIYFYKNGSYVQGTYGTGGGGGSSLTYTHTEEVLNSNDIMKFTTVFDGSSISSPTTIKIKITGATKKKMACNNSGMDTLIQADYPYFSGLDLRYSPSYAGYMYGDVYAYNSEEAISGAFFGNGFTYANGEYTLTNPSITKDANHHYTCNLTNRDGTCSTIRYYYYGGAYINLTNGEGIERAIEKMQTNTTNSNAKTQIDNWYASNMNTITSKLEDTIWCNDRSIGNGNNNGWIANGGDLNTYLYYGAYQRSNYPSNNTSAVKNKPSLVCTNKNDAFTVDNGNGNQKLMYPIALLTEDEMILAGNESYLKNGPDAVFWSMSPSHYTSIIAYAFYFSNGSIFNSDVTSNFGLRPAISLKPGLPVIQGTGTVNDPYVVE